MKLALGLSLVSLSLIFACSSAERTFEPSGGNGGSGAGGDNSGPGGGGDPSAGGGGGSSECQGSMLDCDGSGKCATDGDTDKDHCGSCDTKCFQECRAGGCIDPVQISVGFTHVCALLADGSVWCWGSNFRGEIGPGNPDGATSPVRIELPQKAVAVQAGGTYSPQQDDPWAFSCAILEDGTARCWGAGEGGSLGNGQMVNSSAPVEVKGVTNIVQLSLGGGHACATTGVGKLYCWGHNDWGQVGDNTTDEVATPTSVLSSVKQVTCGDSHTCALKSNGDLYCWGAPQNGQLGIQWAADAGDPVTVPASVPGMNDTDEVSAGSNHTCARKGTTAYCWGNDYSGQVNATFGPVETPVQVDIGGAPPPAKRIIVGNSLSAVIGTDDLVTVWGLTFHGDGEGSTGYAPAKLDIGKTVVFSPGKGNGDGATNCAIKENRQLICWGGDDFGQVGNGDPVEEVTVPNVIAFKE